MTKCRSVFVPHERVLTPVGEVSMARQEFRDECDINILLARYERTGAVPMMNGEPKYLDLSEFPDFHGCMEILREANEAFMRLPAKVRREFDDDPERFVEFAQNPENIDQMRTWGLAAPVAAPEEPKWVRIKSDDPPAEKAE